ncbi:Matrin/U1-C-like C2H2-type zinc finger [Arabidopsis suecica]|uniref:U1 small nuclear ribonucleoprotein C n=1 Tax=Arabidopsis suecica TaxID=45249 RepID=A0A8T1ZHX5_ARASU|nr:Matrin/U1-C-like C2H2-type zinc finger [Arabidopsis suecica]
MPRYYCDYCDTYLTHDSPSVRKQHNAGYKHKANVRIYYQQFEEQQTQSLIDQRIKQHLDQTGGYPQVGAVFNQHMLARPRPPMMLPPGGMPMGMRPPVLPRPMMPGQGYMPPPGVPQMMAPPGAPLPPPPQNGILRPPGMAPIPGQGGGPPPNYNGLPPPPPYHPNPAAPPSGSFNNPNLSNPNPSAESPESNE